MCVGLGWPLKGLILPSLGLIDLASLGHKNKSTELFALPPLLQLLQTKSENSLQQTTAHKELQDLTQSLSILTNHLLYFCATSLIHYRLFARYEPLFAFTDPSFDPTSTLDKKTSISPTKPSQTSKLLI